MSGHRWYGRLGRTRSNDIGWQVSRHVNKVRRIRRATVSHHALGPASVLVVGEAAGEPVGPIGHRFQNPCDGMRNARLKREDAFSHAMIIVSSAMVSSS